MPDTSARKYIEQHYEPADWLAAVLLYRDSRGLTASIKHEFARAGDMASEKRQAHLRAANAHGADIYLGVNALVPGARNRTKADVLNLRHLYLDVDENGPAVLKSVMDAKDLPKPTTVLASSPGKVQVLWRVHSFGKDQAEATVRGLATRHGADEAVWDCARILRVPGFRNNKYPNVQAWVKELPGERSQGVLSPADFPAFQHLERQVARGKPMAPDHHSKSEEDWRNVLLKLEKGEDPAAVKSWLERERADKARPHQYAGYTVEKALRKIGSRR